MKNKGFTLIELLAVIAILAILIMVGVPSVVRIFQEAKVKVFHQDVQNIVRSAERGYAVKLLEKSVEDTIYIYNEGEVEQIGSIDVEMTGAKPKNGILFIDTEGNIAVAIHNGKYCASKATNQREITLEEKDLSECTTYRVISTEKTWSELATTYGVPLEDLLELNEITDSNAPTIGLNIKIPVTVPTTGGGPVEEEDEPPTTAEIPLSGPNQLVIYSAADFVNFVTNVSAGHNYAEREVKFGSDIDLSGVEFSNILPMGTNRRGFSGILDGQGHSIYGLFIDKPSTDYVGLFAKINETGMVRNLSFAEVSIVGKDYTGLVAGVNYGTIVNITLGSGNIEGQDYTGGIAGYSSGTIENSTVFATVTGRQYVGGIVGVNSGTIKYSRAYSDLPIAGQNTGTIE